PAVAARLAELDQFVLGVADLADRCLAGRFDQAGLARGQSQRGHLAFLGHDLDARAGRARHAGAATRLELHRVHRRADGDVPQRQRVAGPPAGPPPRHQPVADPETVRRQDVALLAVRVVQEGDPRGAVRVVLDVRHLGRHPILVTSEIDHPVSALVAAPLVPRGHPALRVPAGAVAPLRDERALGLGARDLPEGGHGGAASPRRRRLVLANGHALLPRLEDLDAVALGELDDRALLVGALAERVAATLDLAGAIQRPDRDHLDVPDHLDGLLDLGLVRPGVDQERVGVLLQARVRLLAHHGPDDHVARRLHSASPPASASVVASASASGPVEAFARAGPFAAGSSAGFSAG